MKNSADLGECNHLGLRPLALSITPSLICRTQPHSIMANFTLTSLDQYDKFLSMFGKQQLVGVNYACGFKVIPRYCIAHPYCA